MLTARRTIRIRGQEVERTPLLVPSFSSKGFPHVRKIIEYCSEIIDGPALVSAYDLHHKHVEGPIEFPSLVFLDSGGYEASRDAELSDFEEREHRPKQWTYESYVAQLHAWRSSAPTMAVSYDHPDERVPIADQIARARDAFAPTAGLGREFLIKPESPTHSQLKIASVVKHIHLMTEFDVIGVTEKEIGASILARMQNIATLRRALTAAGLDTPIHIFGSLDTMTTPLYFLAGADVFDGLTWLRFAYLDGQTIYKQNYGATKLGVSTRADELDARCWNNNYYYLRDLQLEMRRFLHTSDFSCFRFHRDLFRDAHQNTLEAGGH